MKLKNFYQNIRLNGDQQNTVGHINDFLESDKSIFILQGYAGTGKTTLISGIVKYLEENKRLFNIIAPTGRAAKVLKDKTGFGRTIHSSIYKLEDLKAINAESKELADHSVKYYFPIDLESNNERVLIVDESSMISSKEAKNELFDFGTNFLLNDLLMHTFTTNKNNKIIFVGDPAQLPPVGDNQSKALEIDYFKELGYACEFSELTQVMRQDDNLILENANSIRALLKESSRNTIELKYDQESFVKLDSYDIVNQFTNLYPNPEIGDGVIISFSNAQAYHYNFALREVLFPDQKAIVAGDIIMINNNNQYSYKTELYNGDLAKVVQVSQHTVEQSVPVYVLRNGKRIKEIIKLKFREIAFRVPHFDEDICCYIIDDLLNSIDRDLTLDMTKALYINFVMRFNQEQEKRRQNGLSKFKVGSKEFKDALIKDPFYNALRVKYGYAITCHKSQGGEWDKVFVDYSGRAGLSNDALRWTYTATTRGVNTVYAINPPHLTTFSKLKIAEITNVGRIPNNALYLENVNTSPFHKATDHKAKSLKYWEVKEKLEATNYAIINVASRDYLERYTVSYNATQEFILKASHKASGHFVNQFEVLNKRGTAEEKELEDIFNHNDLTGVMLAYKPSVDFLESLYFVVRACCQELDIVITNIDEQVNKYFVQYFLVTDSVTSNIQFYFKKNGSFSRALPKTFNCKEDIKLQLLIKKLEQYAI
ncbi:AAA family ATPase [Polaribacter litorisediminis]|uniref:ATP-dependent DNA helicase n=1 Tax=Polaribacter litorisediminis TaxID=1908341 RepID=UPI001CBEDB0F|nr:AAA family ATPase [Polaribacter litorisediminis]UAM97249.1 AAA family ATPase [Polaribacter litorisediminis]